MLTFAVVTSRHGHRLDPSMLERMESEASAEVPFPPGDSVTWTNNAGTVWFAGWQAPLAHDHRETGWHVDAHGLTAVAGRVWPSRDGWRDAAPVAPQLARLLRTDPLRADGCPLAGVFTVASLAHESPSAVAADPLGMGLLYWGRCPDVVVVSTRASVAAAMAAAATGSPPRRDVFGTGWLAYAGHVVGHDTGYEDIKVVPEGAVLEISPEGGVELRRPSQPVWRAQSEVLAADPRAALDDVRAEITTAIRTALRNTDTRARAGLTGGKDSRLVLALLLSSDCASDVDFQTLGNDDLPDVAIAGRLASTLGLRHLTNPRTRDRVAWRERLNEALGSGHGTPREIAFRITAAVTSGTRSVGEPHLGRLAPPNCLLLSGLCGETIRTNYPATIELRSKEHASRFPYQFGKAGILDAEVLAHYRSEIHEILFEGITEHDSPQDVIDAYYLRQRLRRWAGITMEVDPDARMFPLYSTTAIQLAFGIGAENRHAEWIHYQLMRDAFEPLVHVPFANGSWAPGASKDLVAPATYTDPVPAAPPPPRPARRSVRKKTPALRTVNRERRAKERATDLAIMRNLFRPDSANPAFELIDRRGVQRALDNFDELPDGQRLQLYGALTAVIWLGGHELALPRELAVP